MTENSAVMVIKEKALSRNGLAIAAAADDDDDICT